MGLMRDFCEYCGRLELMLARTRERYWIGCWHVGKIFAIGCDSCTVQHCSESVYRYSGTTRGSWQCDGLVKRALGDRLCTWGVDYSFRETRRTEQTTEILIHRQLTLVLALPWTPRCACDAICCLHYAVR